MARREEQRTTGEDTGIAPEPMVDRVLELDLLRDHLTRVVNGEPGRAVLLLGESGVGKSRLAAAVGTVAAELDVPVISAQCLGQGAEPLLTIKDALSGHLGRDPEAIRRALLGASPRLLDAVPFIGRFLASVGEALLHGRDLRASKDGIYEELARVLIGLSDRHGLLLVVEDLHQADHDTLYFINYLLRKIRDRRILALLTIQEEGLRAAPALADLLAGWVAAGYAVLTVVPLERAHIGEYVRLATQLGTHPDEALIERLFRLTGGNPFFLKETLALVGQAIGGASAELVATRIPQRVDALLRARLSRADDSTLRFLQAVAVLAETTQDLDAIAYLMEADEEAAVQALESAMALRLVTEGPGGEIAFVHSLMQRAVYEPIAVNRRRLLHRRAAGWCEQTGALSSAATHFERAGLTRDMVRTALAAAGHAEQAGMYHSALALYQKVRPHMALEEIGPLLGNAMITLGNWDQAEQLVAQLPEADPRVSLLRSQLRFVRGDFTGAREDARAALRSPDVDRVAVLHRLADIELYLGDFPAAEILIQQALDAARAAGSTVAQARCLGGLGALAFFGGDIDTGQRYFREAVDLVTSVPEGDRDQGAWSVLLGNLGDVAEARGRWDEATELHEHALRIRRETADARGALHSLHALGRARMARGDVDGGLALFDQAERLAADLGETLERAKITHSRARLALAAGAGEDAYQLARNALEVFATSRTGYDVAHTRVTLAAAARVTERGREAAEQGADARSAIRTSGYGLLRIQYPNVAYTVADRIAGALTAYACGDALGLPFENVPPPVPAPDEIETVPAARDWPRGSTSDDTALTLLVARYLIDTDIDTDTDGDTAGLLRVFADQEPPVKGIGPSTTAAIKRFRATGALPETGGATNGGPMRALPVGWATSIHDADRRRAIAVRLTRATHPDPGAVVAACVVAACAAWSVEDATPDVLLAVAVAEQQEAATLTGGGDRLAALLDDVRTGRYVPPDNGIGLDALDTVAAVLFCVTHATSLRDGLLKAVGLGGDTDTVAAITGGLLGAAHSPAGVFAALPWHTAVQLPDAGLVTELANGLDGRRGRPIA